MNYANLKKLLETKPFRPRKLFSGGHAQTLLGYFYPRRRKLNGKIGVSEARIFEVAANAKLLAHCVWQADKRSAPTLVLVHGLEGSSRSVYILGTAAKAFAVGFNVVRLNLRTCGETEHLSETLYHSGLSADLRFVVGELIARDKLEKIFVAGFSLGGNMSLKFAGEFGDDAPPQLRGVAAVSPSIDLAGCADLIEQRSNQIYNGRFIVGLKKRMRRIARLYPTRYDLKKLKSVRTIREFDALITAPYNGFADADDYYQRSSALQFINKINVPTLIIAAQDDPFIPFAPFADAALSQNPNVILLAPKHGGHVGFIQEKLSGEDNFWAENRIVEFFKSLESLGSLES